MTYFWVYLLFHVIYTSFIANFTFHLLLRITFHFQIFAVISPFEWLLKFFLYYQFCHYMPSYFFCFSVFSTLKGWYRSKFLLYLTWTPRQRFWSIEYSEYYFCKLFWSNRNDSDQNSCNICSTRCRKYSF